MSDTPPPQEPGGNGDRGHARAFDRVPPHSLDAEVSVLGASLLSRTAAIEVQELLAPDDFYRTAHRTVFEAVSEIMARGDAVDPVTLLDHLAGTNRLDEVGGANAIHDLVSATPTAANAGHYARIVRDKSMLRRLIEAGTDIVRLGYEPTDDPVASVSEAESIMFRVADQGVRNEATPLKDLLNESFAAIEELSEKGDEVTGLPTGFVDLDRLTAGFQPQNLIVLAARPAMGKSSLVLSMAHYVTAQLRRPVALFSLEMSKQEIVTRLLSSEGMIDSQRLKTGRLEDSDWRRLGDALGVLSEAPLFIDDTPSINLMEIMAKSRRIKQRHGLEMVIVDYLQLMQSHRRVDNRQQEVAEISRGLKMLAKELNVPVIALSQLNRSPEARTDKRPMLADLRESGCLTRATRLFRADTGTPVTFGELLDRGVRDLPVWTTDAAGRLVAGNLDHAFPSGVKEVYRVQLRSGLTIEATANHPFRTLDGWHPLGELGVGARVAAARRLPPPERPEVMDPDELVLLAHMIGEGTMVARQPIHYTSADAANIEAVVKAAWQRFGIRARRVPDARSARTTQVYLPAPYHLTHGVRSPVAAWLDDLGLWNRRSWEKRLPAQLFSLDVDQLRQFVKHLWSTDGTLVIRKAGGKGPRVVCEYATSSPGLAGDVQLLLRRLEIMATVRRVEHPRGRPGYRVRIVGAAQQRHFLQTVGLHGERADRIQAALRELDGVVANPNVDVLPPEVWELVHAARRRAGMTEREFQAAIGTAYCGSTLYRSAPSRARLARIAEALADDRLHRLASDDLHWDEIVAVDPLGPQQVYDATVDVHHNFVAEGLVLHNSVEQDADIVGFIYRDEVYNEDSPDQGIAELIIAKHRNGDTRVVRLAFLGHVTKFANLARGSTPPQPGPGGGNGANRGASTPV